MSDRARVAAERAERLVTHETIGCALAVLRRIDYHRCDEDVRDVLAQVRSKLSVCQSSIKERIEQSIQEGLP